MTRNLFVDYIKYSGSVLEQNEVALDLDLKFVMEAFKTKTENAMLC